VAIGRIVAPRGVRGELKVEPLTDFPERFAPGQVIWLGGLRREVEGSRQQRSHLLLKLAGVDSAEQAAALRGELLEVPQEELHALGEGQYYRFQLQGMAVYDTAGQALGTIVDILSTGANDVYVVRGPRGELLLPAIEEVVKEVNAEGGRMVVELMEGMEPR
jgi:16S rRNA processing protein RimM